MLELVLTQDGFSVLAVDSGAAGLRIAADVPDLALVTLDLGLPDMDGRDVARSLRPLSAAPILMITAFAEASDELDGIAAGANTYLTKPYRACPAAGAPAGTVPAGADGRQRRAARPGLTPNTPSPCEATPPPAHPALCQRGRLM